jgi:AmpD protein
MRLEKGWLDKAKRCPSPNYDVRSNEEIDLIVIHSISLPPGIFGNSFVEDFFQNKLDHSKDKYFQEIKDLKVSSHFLIKRDGEITQFVSILDRAWHAGVSSFEGREDCNDYSIGIELEGTDVDCFEENQYESLVSLTSTLMSELPRITLDRIVGHSDIAPGRKSDPGKGFDWDKFKDRIIK